MPFTFVHPLYAAPVQRLAPQYLSVTGLVLGSMAPDFEYFIMLEPYQLMGHTWKGLLLEAIPLSVLFAFLFHLIMKEQLARHLPSYFELDRRSLAFVSTWRLPSIGAWLLFILSVSIGFGSHVLVDSFTHQSGWAVQQLPQLQATAVGIPIYKWIQHSLSMVGLAVEVYWIYRIGRQVSPTLLSSQLQRVPSARKRTFWAIVVLVAMLTLMAKLLFSSRTNWIGILVVAPFSGSLLGLLLAAMHAKWSGRGSHHPK
ncbi:hypothetical protein BBG47_07650 [Paenibacillus sp. KS1]|uniref:DUF4184 family protein n=1 Tax=Paenibacillus sp. KS1 TaxID=1849249 RepID=UPI00080670A5|nr:DUF4184 family protein [Paenibacillus sp. KS1]OBY80140.1 hypothetical protein BBG47_07650 [Paenibacillus sp. KS1]